MINTYMKRWLVSHIKEIIITYISSIVPCTAIICVPNINATLFLTALALGTILTGIHCMFLFFIAKHIKEESFNQSYDDDKD